MTDETMDVTVYGASDDLVEIDGGIRDEYYLASEGTRLRFTSPDGESLDVYLNFGSLNRNVELDWTISVEATTGYPSWPVRFHERPDREGDPAVTLTVPVGTTVKNLSEQGNG